MQSDDSEAVRVSLGDRFLDIRFEDIHAYSIGLQFAQEEFEVLFFDLYVRGQFGPYGPLSVAHLSRVLHSYIPASRVLQL